MLLSKDQIDYDPQFDAALAAALSSGKWEGRLHFAIIAAILTITLLVLNAYAVPSAIMIATMIMISTLCLILVLNFVLTTIHANLLTLSGQIAWMNRQGRGDAKS